MNERLKSFHKLFFIVLFTFLFSGIWGSEQVPDLENRIAPELERIEALPRRTRPAELDIEVTKIKTEPLSEVYIDRESKNIYVDFSGKKAKTPKGAKSTEELEKQYNLSVSQSLESSGSVNGKQRTKMKNGPQTMKHELAELEGKKVLKIPYETEPEKLYISVNENDNGKTVKVYSLDLKNALTIDPRGVIETKTVIINLANGIENYEGKTIIFNLDGSFYLSEIPTAEIQVIKQSGFPGVDGFINSFPGAADIAMVGTDLKTTKQANQDSGDMQRFFTDRNNDGFAFKYSGDGKLNLRFQQIVSIGRQTYEFDITHTSGTDIKKHKLIINSNIFINRKEATVKYLNGYDGGETTFDINGKADRSGIEVTKNNFTEGFINGFGASTPTYITVQQIDSSGNNIGATASAGRGANSTTGIEINMTDAKISFLNTGTLRLNMTNLDKSKSYRYRITHRNSNSPTGTVMMEHILNIQSRRKLMERTASLNDIVIEDVEGLNLETIYDFGTLGMEQIGNGSDLIDKTNPFPALALGAQGTVSSSTGWSYSSNSTNTQSRDPITTAYKSTLATSITMQMYFANTTGIITNTEGGAVTILKKGNPETVVGAFGDAKREKMLTNLKGKITGDLNSLLTQFRASTAKEIIFESQSKANEQISYVVAQKTSAGYYSVPSVSDLNTSLVSDAKIEYRNYPKIMLKKPVLQEENLTLTIGDGFNLDSSIPFTNLGINDVPNASLTSGSRYFKSLHFAGNLKINGVLYPIDATGNSVSIPDITLVNTNGDDLKLNIRYNGRYPEFKILNTPKRGEYVLNMSHHEPSGLELLQYTLKIKIDTDITPKEFKVTSNIRDILIFPQADDTATVEMPDNWVKVEQLVDDKGRFPVIGVNKPKWVISTDTPLNPIDMRPMAVLKLGTETISVPVNIRETPYQNPQKFFVYNRGEMTNKNLAVGAYTPISSTDGSGKNNRVQVGFQMFLEKEHLDKILAYGNSAEFNGKDRVEIPYGTGEDHNIYAIRGIQQGSSEKFAVTEDNILDDGTIPFPKIFVIKNNIPSSNSATLTFSNPVPKSFGNISGTFDIIDGDVFPNNLMEYSHPNSLTVSDMTASWPGFTIISEHHKIRISSATETKEFTTTELGEMKGTQTITSGNNKYLFMKGKSSPLAIGILEWDFAAKIKDTITLEHLTTSGRVLQKDEYSINLEMFSPNQYLDVINSSLITSRGSNNDLTVTANSRQDFIDLGTLKLQNYEKNITKTGNLDSVTSLYGNEIRIEAVSDLITLNLSSNPSSTVKLKGRLVFDSGKNNVSKPNESRSLRFKLDESNSSQGISGKTFTITSPNNRPLITIKGGGKEDIILNQLTLILTAEDSMSGDMTDMNFVSTLTSLTVNENDIERERTEYTMPGKMSLRQVGSAGVANSVPAIALGDYADWRTPDIGISNTANITTRSPVTALYKIGDETIEIYPELLDPQATLDRYLDNDGKPVSPDILRLHQQKTSAGKILTALTWVTNRSQRHERITTGLKLTLKGNQWDSIKRALRNTPGDRVELKPASTVLTESSNKAKIAYIHSREDLTVNKIYIPHNKDEPTPKFAYQSLPSIFIEKEKLYKNVEINILPTYVLNERIIFNSSNPQIPIGVTINSQDNRVLEGLSYGHKIRLTFPSGETKEYETTSTGATTGVITETVEKNGKNITINIEYKDGETAEIWISDRSSSQFYDFVLQHIDPSGDVRRTTNISINSGVSSSTAEFGEIDLLISSRYNAADGQLNSDPLLITSEGIKYQTEVLDLKLLSGDYPEKPEDKTVYINNQEISTLKDSRVRLTNGTVIRIIKESNGDLRIKPIFWQYGVTDSFILTYKKGEAVTDQYSFNVKCPEFFVASIGELDFGKIYKMGNPPAITKTTDIELWYNDAGITAEYSIDLDSANPDAKTLYMDEAGKLSVTNLHLGDEKIDSGDGRRRILPLTGTIPGESIKDAPHGKYMKTLQILIHLK